MSQVYIGVVMAGLGGHFEVLRSILKVTSDSSSSLPLKVMCQRLHSVVCALFQGQYSTSLYLLGHA